MPLRCRHAVLVIAAASLALGETKILVPSPTVTGPIKWTAKPPDASHGYPFNPTYLDLAAQGYVEEEFFIEGTANRYKTSRDATATLMDDGHGYKTRIVVRRPTSAKKFNGTAILEWTNVTGGR